ncbi:NAD(+) synthase [Suttonella sp. R2A3]|uniref:NAD(+) synthase n=1 Tax=Suttonella sp. R2A3 TaxID=2908648 RepID=UPI001F025BA2|nr:NAD(+) synthase [Suttonella sp. R2A3]UJF24337.1 NAD(+) synthase [Suttonella sp. R2A3]
MDVAKYVDYLVDWLERERRDFYKMDGYVLGVSGGVDSAVVAHLLAKTGAPVTTLMLPSSVSSDADEDYARSVLDHAGLSGDVVSIAPMYEAVMASVAPLLGDEEKRVNVLRGNLQARLRMITLYTVAQSRRAVVVGTDNAAEWYTGYFTKYGDGAADVVPMTHLRKEQVYELARYLGVPEGVINKPPSAGLWQGQTDEGEMGVTYQDLDAFLRGESVSEAAEERIAFWHDRSYHKREMPRTPLSPDEY